MTRKNLINIFLIILFSIVSINLIGCSTPVEANTGDDISNQSGISTALDDFPQEEVSPEEMKGLIFMREEEKLARDVYTFLYEKWGQRIFSNISQSEQRHTDAIKFLLDKYAIADPVGNDSVGVFNNDVLQNLYNQLTEQGQVSLVEALKVGALIEEIDILDIQKELDGPVDNQDITFVYQNLIKGSRNHLRAFVRNLSRRNVTYTPQILSAEQFSTIINSDWERGNRR
jgi:hypothetical protein